MKDILGYVRVSTEEQAIHGLSIEAQTAALEAWARANDCKISQIYVDAGISARKPASKRPALQQLLNAVRSGNAGLIVFTKLDRWFRNIAEYYKVQEVLEKHHVDWKTIHEDYDTSTASGRLKINIMLSVAQDEADRTSERIKAVFEMKRQKLEPLTGNCPTGYKIEGKKMLKDPETKEAVAEFFRRYLASGSITVAQNYVLDHFGMRISYKLAHRMLNSPTYRGEFYGTDGMVPPYITKEESEKIQSMRQRPVRKVAQNRVYIFSGLIICGECGARMGGRMNARCINPFYNCSAHYTKRSGCENRVNVNEKIIEQHLLDGIEGKMNAYRLEIEKMESGQRQRNVKAEISALRSKLAKLKELFVNDFISMEEYKKDHAAITEKLEELIRQDKPVPKENFQKLEGVFQSGWKDDYDSINKEEKREFWRILIKEIRIYPDRSIDFDLNL